jgi:hypothetical protein
VRDDGPDELVVVLPGHGRAATAAWLHPVLRELADHVDPARGLAGARLRGSVHGTNGRAGVQLIQDIVASAEPVRRRHATAEDSGGLTDGGLTDGGLTDGGVRDGGVRDGRPGDGALTDGSADDGQPDEQGRTSEDARAEGDDARRTASGRRARRRAAAGDPLGPASYVLGASEFSGSAAEESGPLLGDLLYRELSGTAATDVGDASGGAGAGRRRRDEAADGERSEGVASRNGRPDGDEPSGRRARKEAAGQGAGSAEREDSDAEGTAAENPARSVTPRASGARRRRAEDSSFHISDLEIRPGSGGRRHRDDEESVESGRPRRGADAAGPTGAPTPIRRSRQSAETGAAGGRRRRRSRDVFADSLDGVDLPADGPRPGDDARNRAEAGGAAAGRADAGRADAIPADGSRTDTNQTDRSRTDESRTGQGSTDRDGTDRDGTDENPTRERPGTTPSTSDDSTDFGENLGLGDLLAGALAAYRGL